MEQLVVTLTEADVDFCRQVGKARMANARRLGLKDKTAPTVGGTVGSEIGCVGEFAFAQVIGRPWKPRIMSKEELKKWYEKSKKDFGRLEVRTTPRLNGCLLINPNDSLDTIFVLAIYLEPDEVYLKGWIDCKSGKKKMWYREGDYGRPLYYVPQSALKPMSTLIEQIKEAST